MKKTHITIEKHETIVNRLKRKGESFQTLASRLFSERNSLADKNDNLREALVDIKLYGHDGLCKKKKCQCPFGIAEKALEENEK